MYPVKGRKSSTRRRAIAAGYRSGLEETIAKQLEDSGVPYEYEAGKIEYSKPVTKHKYTWDFKLPNGIIIESKGMFTAADRKKHLLIKKQRPELDIRFVFSRSKTFLTKSKGASYGSWCEKNGFLYADKLIPEEWINEE